MGYLANVDADSDQPPQMRRPAVHLQHAYEHLKFERKKRVSIDMKAYRKGRHKSECKKLDKLLLVIKKKFVDALPEGQQVLLEWEFGTGNSCSLNNLHKTWDEYAEAAGVEPSELPVVVSINEPFFRKSDKQDFEWAIHIPMRICSPMILINRPTYSDPTERDFNREAKALFSFSTSIAVKKPPAPPKTAKKRKAEGDASGAEEGDAEQTAGEELLAQVPLPLPEPEEVAVPRLTRARRA